MTTNEAMGEGWPEVLTVEQAAAILQIGRSSAYDLARQFLATDGAKGLPVIRVGRLMRVPRGAARAAARRTAPDPTGADEAHTTPRAAQAQAAFDAADAPVRELSA